jgi:hypothetical protein
VIKLFLTWSVRLVHHGRAAFAVNSWTSSSDSLTPTTFVITIVLKLITAGI